MNSYFFKSITHTATNPNKLIPQIDLKEPEASPCDAEGLTLVQQQLLAETVAMVEVLNDGDENVLESESSRILSIEKAAEEEKEEEE